MAARSPVFTHLSETLNGLSTIRTMKAEQMVIAEFDNHQNINSSANYMFISVSRAFGLWLDMTLAIFIAIVVLSVIGKSGADIGLAITQSMTLIGKILCIFYIFILHIILNFMLLSRNVTVGNETICRVGKRDDIGRESD